MGNQIMLFFPFLSFFSINQKMSVRSEGTVCVRMLGKIWERFLHCKGGQALEQAAQGSGAVPLLAGFKMCGCGTEGHGLV